MPLRRTFAALAFALASALMPAAADVVPGGAEALNAFRADNGRGAVRHSPRLQKAAESHAQAMAQGGWFAHTSPSGSTLTKRARAVGYRFCYVSENIAKGQDDLPTVMRDWAGSRGHRRNMLARKATEFGLARAPGDIWVMVLGKPGC